MSKKKEKVFMVYDRVKYLREQNGYTQSDLANILGISRSSVNAWEMGISNISVKYVKELADIFNVSTDYLLGFEKSSTINITGLNEEQVAIIAKLVDYLKDLNSK